MKILAKAGFFSAKEIEGKGASGPYKMYVISKSRKDEKTGEWKDESIFLKAAELAVIGELALAAFTNIVREAAEVQNSKQQEGGVDY